MNAESWTGWWRGRQDAFEEALRSLVEVNSFTENRQGGVEVGRRLRDLLALPGIDASAVASTRFADHRVFRTAGDARLAPVALIGHLDTVFPPGKFEGYRVDGSLRRRPGVLDMKGGLVVVAFALRGLAEAYPGGLAALPPLRIVVVSDEEVGSPEGADVIRRTIGGSDAALVFESGRAQDAIITRRKGTGNVSIVAQGKAAHAGNAHAEGKNAIWAVARWVDAAQQLTDYERGVTVNVGTVSGGIGKNTVPEHAEAHADIRYLTHVDGEALVQRLRDAAERAAASVPGTRLVLSGGTNRAPLERTPANVALMEEYAEAARASGLGAVEAGLIGGASDASTTSGMGIASIDGLGPRGRGFHTVDEQIEVETLIPKAEALARFLAGRARAGGG
ncbi:MAG TPA: M20/M25/M40 family metallo-hydrolase [Myxococcaceae bacterium]|nr:M20/M25/M40 family metallo-hydrolase [Myxococcaceae bacterium]